MIWVREKLFFSSLCRLRRWGPSCEFQNIYDNMKSTREGKLHNFPCSLWLLRCFSFAIPQRTVKQHFSRKHSLHRVCRFNLMRMLISIGEGWRGWGRVGLRVRCKANALQVCFLFISFHLEFDSMWVRKTISNFFAHIQTTPASKSFSTRQKTRIYLMMKISFSRKSFLRRFSPPLRSALLFTAVPPPSLTEKKKRQKPNLFLLTRNRYANTKIIFMSFGIKGVVEFSCEERMMIIRMLCDLLFASGERGFCVSFVYISCSSFIVSLSS